MITKNTGNDLDMNLHLQLKDQYLIINGNLDGTDLHLITENIMEEVSRQGDIPKTTKKGSQRDPDLLKNHESLNLCKVVNLDLLRKRENLVHYLQIERRNLREADLHHQIIEENQESLGQTQTK